MSGMKRKYASGFKKAFNNDKVKKVKKSGEETFAAAGEDNVKSDDDDEPGQDDDDEDDNDDEIYDPALSKKPKTVAPILVILDLASLETVKTKRGEFQLLNCDDHIGIIRKFRKDPSDYRPDIIHQELMAVLDSPLNKAGKVKVLVHTEKNVLFEINAKTRIPRTFKRFSGLMVQLLHRLKIRSSDGKDMLIKVIKNPISRHIPAGAKCIGIYISLLTYPMNSQYISFFLRFFTFGPIG